MCKGDIRACCIPILVANRTPGSVIATEENRSKPSVSDLSSVCLWSDEVGIVFSGNRAKESVLSTSANPSADYVPIKDGDRVGASDPMTALLIYVGGRA
jgi:hypothetical protein